MKPCGLFCRALVKPLLVWYQPRLDSKNCGISLLPSRKLPTLCFQWDKAKWNGTPPCRAPHTSSKHATMWFFDIQQKTNPKDLNDLTLQDTLRFSYFYSVARSLSRLHFWERKLGVESAQTCALFFNSHEWIWKLLKSPDSSHSVTSGIDPLC